jgi:ribosomal protein L16 Arg81 hydroxylase
MNSGISLEDIIHPLSRAKFLQDFFDQKHFHSKGVNDRFRGLLTASQFMEFIKISSLWDETTLKLYHQGRAIPFKLFSQPSSTLTPKISLSPSFELIQSYLAEGATLVANDIGLLTPRLKEISHTLAESLEAPVQANLYYSVKTQPGFLTHFDVHDVFVFHLEGEKKWRLYEGKAVAPINHPIFNTLTQEMHEAHKGPLLTEVYLKPGSFLYLPRGMYHDALALTDHSLHISFGITRPIGLKAISLLFEAILYEEVARQNLPFLDEPQQFSAHLKALGNCANDLLNNPHFQDQLKAQLISDYKID